MEVTEEDAPTTPEITLFFLMESLAHRPTSTSSMLLIDPADQNRKQLN